MLGGASNANLVAGDTFWFAKLVQHSVACRGWVRGRWTFAKLFILCCCARCVLELYLVSRDTNGALLLIVPIVPTVKLLGLNTFGRLSTFTTLDLVATRAQVWQQLAGAVLALRVDAFARAFWH